MLNSNLCDYSDAFILVKRTTIITGVIYKNCPPLTDSISEVNNTQKDNAKHLDVVIFMYNLIKCSKNYLRNHLVVYVNIIKIEPNFSLTVS